MMTAQQIQAAATCQMCGRLLARGAMIGRTVTLPSGQRGHEAALVCVRHLPPIPNQLPTAVYKDGVHGVWEEIDFRRSGCEPPRDRRPTIRTPIQSTTKARRARRPLLVRLRAFVPSWFASLAWAKRSDAKPMRNRRSSDPGRGQLAAERPGA